MKTTADYLDALRVHFAVKSDYALAPLIGISQPHMSRYRKLKGTFSEEFCLKISDWLETDPAEIFAAMHYQREKNEAARKVWERIYRSMGAVAAAVLLVIFVPGLLPQSDIVPALLLGFTTSPRMYIMSNELNLTLTILILFFPLFVRLKLSPSRQTRLK